MTTLPTPGPLRSASSIGSQATGHNQTSPAKTARPSSDRSSIAASSAEAMTVIEFVEYTRRLAKR